MTTSARSRTRHAILLAAIRVLSANHSASTTDIAAEADVARSTVHRYFPDRRSLTEALHQFVDAEYFRIVAAVRLDEGTGREALLRLATELADSLEIFGWWMQSVDDDAREDDTDDMSDPDIERVVERGHHDGTLDPRLPSTWINGLLWSMLYSVNALTMTSDSTRGETRALFLHSLDKAIRAD